MTFADVYPKLREPFKPEQIGKLPRVTCKDCIDKKCQKHQRSKCAVCGAYVSPQHMHIDYVGHAPTTERLNAAAGGDWTYVIDEMFTMDKTCWVKGTMTIAGISRPEYGDGKNPKEAVGNFIRRGAMRFGVAIDLWSKEELEGSTDVEPVAGGPEGSADRSHTPADGKADVDGEMGGEGTRTQGAAPVSPEGSDGLVEDAPSEPEPGGPEAGTVAASDGGRGSSGAAPPLLSSQAKQLLRHAVSLRWGDDDISAAVAEAYPGLGAIGELSQEQARALIDEWRKLVAATRITKEQRDRIKPLATNTDAARRAQVLFGADHIKNVGDLTMAEAEALISDLEGMKEAS